MKSTAGISEACGSAATDGELYLAWTLQSTQREAHELLASGERRKLYTLTSWVVTEDAIEALLRPAASLEEITAAIWSTPPKLNRARWISTRSACMEITREIETAPVRLGLARRPEEWPFSSAAAD